MTNSPGCVILHNVSIFIHNPGEKKTVITRIAIIGAGPGGYVAAIEAARLGAVVTVIEREEVGGTCLNWGCIPTKTWKTAAGYADTVRMAGEYGVITHGEAEIDLRRLLARKRTVVEIQRKGIYSLFRKHGVRYLEGKGIVAGSHLVRVERLDGAVEDVAADRLILAAGSSPLPLAGIPFDRSRIISTNEAVNLAAIPGSVLIVGGGVNGCEFASIFSALGAKVTIVEALPRLLPLSSIDADSAVIVGREMKKRKIAVLLNRIVEEVSVKDGKTEARIVSAARDVEPGSHTVNPVLVEADMVLVAAGRKPNTEGMGLETLGLETDPAGWIAANERMETNIPDVYSVGDMLGPQRPMLAHVASAEGVTAARNAMGAWDAMDYTVIPAGVFTTPEAASVGLTEAQAREQGDGIRTSTIHLRVLGKAQAMGEIAGQVKIVADTGGKILGVHIVGAHATDLIAEGALALKMGATAEDLVSTIHAHPTLSEAFMEAASDLLRREPL